jgi:hypothetical protein
MMLGRDFISQGCIEDWMDVNCRSGKVARSKNRLLSLAVESNPNCQHHWIDRI